MELQRLLEPSGTDPQGAKLWTLQSSADPREYQFHVSRKIFWKFYPFCLRLLKFRGFATIELQRDARSDPAYRLLMALGFTPQT
jgi:hypothetical protein